MLSLLAGPAVARSVYPLAGLSTFKSVKLATPLAGARVKVPDNFPGRVPGPLHGLTPIATVTVSGGAFPNASRTVTSTRGITMFPCASAG